MPSSVANYLNQLSTDDAYAALEKCCAAPKWIHAMIEARPLNNDQAVFDMATNCWATLDRNSRLTAFAAHPRIGDVESLRKRFANTKQWVAGEQAAVQQASGEILQALATANDAYYEKFGYIFIVSASGKSADEMFQNLRSRLRNDAETELQIASREQLEITLLRLQKLIQS